MPSQDNSQPSSNLPSFAEALAAANQMQQDWLEHGVNFVDRYVEDVEGNWLDQWGEDEPAENGSVSSDCASSQPLAEHDSFIKAVVTFLMSNDPVAIETRPFWESRPLPEIATHLERCLALPQVEQSYAVQDLLVDSSITSGSNYRNLGNNNNTDILELAESLLMKLTEILNSNA